MRVPGLGINAQILKKNYTSVRLSLRLPTNLIQL